MPYDALEDFLVIECQCLAQGGPLAAGPSAVGCSPHNSLASRRCWHRSLAAARGFGSSWAGPLVGSPDLTVLCGASQQALPRAPGSKSAANMATVWLKHVWSWWRTPLEGEQQTVGRLFGFVLQCQNYAT